MVPYRSKVLKSGQYIIANEKFSIQPPRFFKLQFQEKISEEEKKIKELEAQIKKLEEEIEKKKRELEEIEEKMLEEAREKADRIIEEAERGAFSRVQRSLQEKSQILKEAEEEKNRIINEAKVEAQKIIEEARKEAEKIKEEARERGFQIGRDEGFNIGRMEVEKLIERLRTIASYIVEKRDEIINKSEQQIIELILMLVKKIVKYLSENEERVVIENIKSALNKIKGKTTIIIRVNPDDLDIATKYKEEFLKLLEEGSSIKIFEDVFVDKGGVIIETDMGIIDARISRQLEELEEKIKSIVPS